MTEKKQDDDKGSKYLDPITGKPIPGKKDFEELFENLSNMLMGSGDETKKKKMSYSISKPSQFLIKNLSEESGATQGSIIDLAPFFFGTVMQKSMTRRSETLPLLEELIKNIQGTLKGIIINAPHLEEYINRVDHMLTEILQMENDSVKNNNYQGVDPKPFDSISDIDDSDISPPYIKDIMDFLETGSKLESIFKTLF